jgi:hypothetical protein
MIIDVAGNQMDVPDGASDADIARIIKKNALSLAPQKQNSFIADGIKAGNDSAQMHKDILAGVVRGAGSIGDTLLTPVDAAARALGIQNDFIGRTDRREAMDSGLQELGANTNSLAFKSGKLGGEIAGTAGAGGLVANGLSKIPALASAAPELINAIRAGGFGPNAGNMLTRFAGGVINGAATSGLVDPANALVGAGVGGVLPGASKVAGKVGEMTADAMQSGSRKLMQSALKPTIAQLRTGDAQSTVDTLLKYGINPTKGGVEKMRGMVDDLNQQISDKIASSGATVDKQKVLGTLGDVRQQFGTQVSPTADMNAIQSVADDFAAHPSLPTNDIPVQLAQDMKQGTYRVLAKKYGQIGSAETEAQKALARGLKEQIASAVPEVGGLNASESELLTALKVSERRALMDMNKNPMGLAALAHNPASWAMFMADKSALFKSLAARMVNSSASVAERAGGLLSNAQPSPLLTTGGLLGVQGTQR